MTGKREEAAQQKRTSQENSRLVALGFAAAQQEVASATKLANKFAMVANARVKECTALQSQLEEAGKETEALQVDIRCKEQQLKVARARAGGSRREALQIEVLNKENTRLMSEVKAKRATSEDLKAELSMKGRYLRVEKDKVQGLQRKCGLMEGELEEVRAKLDFFSSPEADEGEYNPWYHDRELRRQCRQAEMSAKDMVAGTLEGWGKATEVNKQVFAFAQQQALLAAENAEKLKQAELDMAQYKHALANPAVRKVEDGRQVAEWVRLTYMKLLTAGVSARLCASVVEIVLAEQPGMESNLLATDLPTRKFADQVRLELGALAQVDCAVKMADHAHRACVLGCDEGSHNQESKNVVMAHYGDIPTQCLGIQNMSSHYSQEGADQVQSLLKKYELLSERVTKDLSVIDLSPAERALTFSVGTLTGTITDQCNTQKKTNQLLEQIKAEKVAQWNAAATEEDKARRNSDLDGTLQHIYCYIHAGVNLAAKFDEIFRSHGASSAKLRANVEDEHEDDEDAEPEEAPEEYEIEAIVATRVRPGAAGACPEKEYRVRWKGWAANHDTWEPASNMLHSEDMIAEHEKTGAEVMAGKKAKVTRRSTSKLQSVVYEIGKFICVQGGKGVKEDQKGVSFMKWCMGKGYKDQLDIHLRMMPVVGTRYFVYHYNPRIIYHLREYYLEFIEHVRANKTKPGLNRLEASIKKLLGDDHCLAQMRAAAILCEQIEQPIMWLAKQKTALQMRQVSADVLGALKHWTTPAGATELFLRPGTLVRQAYAEDKDDALMAAVVRPHTTDEDVIALLQSCCEVGIEHWQKHAGFGLDQHAARVVTAQDELCVGPAPSNNDSCERGVARVRYIKTGAPRMRHEGVQAQVMAKQNNPFIGLKAGRLGNVNDVLELARDVAKETRQAMGNRLDECERLVKEQKRYQELCGPRISQGPAVVTRRDNQVAAMAAAADVEANLMFSELELTAMKLKDLQALKRGWVAVGKVAFGNGSHWQAVFTKDGEGSGVANAEGKCGVVKKDYIADLMAAMKSYNEVMQAWEDHHDEGDAPASSATDPATDLATDPATDPAIDPTIDPAADPTADPGADPGADPAEDSVAVPPSPAEDPAAAPAPNPASDRHRRISRPPQHYDSLKDGANDQTRLGLAKPKQLKKRKRPR